jgi:hypothetical protein
MRYVESAWARPFGGEEGAGWGAGDGTVTGAVLSGRLRWSNSPRRREDGVWTPNVRGVIDTDDGAAILLSMHGQSVEQDTEEGLRRAILARIELLTDAEQYRWVNTTFVVAEGEIDEDTEEIWFQAFVCVNDAVAHAPAIGETPPDPFRQGS